MPLYLGLWNTRDDPAAREAYLAETPGLKSALPRIVKAGYNVLNLQYFFTAGDTEVRVQRIDVYMYAVYANIVCILHMYIAYVYEHAPYITRIITYHSTHLYYTHTIHYIILYTGPLLDDPSRRHSTGGSRSHPYRF